MDIYDYLKKDHQKVKNFFKQFKKANKQRRIAIYEMIKHEITIHMLSEQATFYKALEKFNESSSATHHSMKEHDELKQKMDEIDSTPMSTEEWKKKIIELEKLVDHHVSEEENNLFDQAKKVLSNEEAWRIKHQMHDFKEKLMEEVV